MRTTFTSQDLAGAKTGVTSRLRSRPAVRNLLESSALSPADLSLVLLVTEKSGGHPMPTVTLPEIRRVVADAERLGIRSVKLFAESAERDSTGEIAAARDSLMVRAVHACKETSSTLAVMTETCLCSYTEDGVCFLTGRDGHVDLRATMEVTARQAIAHADAGADIVGPASMVLETVTCTRQALDQSGYEAVSLMPHVIFWSSLYEGFRLTMGASPKRGTDREFQIHPWKADQFVDTALRMERAGADMLLLEPAQFTADVLTALSASTAAPLFPFSVSGEYATLTRVDAETGNRDVRLLVELFTMLKRAGASACITYAALDIARQLT